MTKKEYDEEIARQLNEIAANLREIAELIIKIKGASK